MTSPVRQTSAAVDAMAENWELIDCLMGGTKAMRAANKRYLPQWPAEDAQSYQARLNTATLFPAYERTVAVMTGKPFSKPVTIGEDVPPAITEWTENIDLQGRNLHAFASELCWEAIAYGFGGILVDYPKADGVRTRADEVKAGVRPYWVHVAHGDILGWKTQLIGGTTQLTQLRILESIESADGEFGTKFIEQVRVLEPGRWLGARVRAQEPRDYDGACRGRTKSGAWRRFRRRCDGRELPPQLRQQGASLRQERLAYAQRCRPRP
jgi:hypothetical protein